jgi:hypothetical protein
MKPHRPPRVPRSSAPRPSPEKASPTSNSAAPRPDGRRALRTRPTLEEKALRAMLRALTPGATDTPAPSAEGPALRRIAELEAKVKKLEQDKRRGERLLFLTRKLVKPGKMTTGARGRAAKARPISSNAGPRPSPCSSPSGSAKPTTSLLADSIPTRDGADGS